METITIEKWKLANLLMRCYSSWVSYWQLIMEQEREREELWDAFNSVIFAGKFAMPSGPMESRQLHSKKWFDCKIREWQEYIEIINTTLQDK